MHNKDTASCSLQASLKLTVTLVSVCVFIAYAHYFISLLVTFTFSHVYIRVAAWKRFTVNVNIGFIAKNKEILCYVSHDITTKYVHFETHMEQSSFFFFSVKGQAHLT